jgi:hypothetical protein
MNSQSSDVTTNARRMSRRKFGHALGVAAAGAAGAASSQAVAPHQLLAAQTQPAGGDEFERPATLRAGSQLDSRFRVSFVATVHNGFRLVTDYFTALSERNLDGIASTLHFPFALYEDIEPVVVDRAADFMATPPPSLNGTGKGKTRLQPGSYDLLESMNVHLYCPIGGVFSLSFTRYTADGHKLLRCDGIYSVTNNDARWGIQLASTIVHEVDFIGITYPDAEAADIRGNQNYLAAFGYDNERILNDPATSRGSYEQPLPIGTRTASVSFGYGPRERSRDAREGNPMRGWRTKGVKSRLNVSVVSDASRSRVIETNLAEFKSLAGGAVGEYAYTRDLPTRPVTLHATHDKAHTLGGYLRYTADGTLISETRSVGIRIYKAGHWASAGSLGQVTHHDRSNSRR